MTSETMVILRTYPSLLFGNRKKVKAGRVIIQTNTVTHMIIERFLIHQEPYLKFTYQDIKDVLEQEFFPRAFGMTSIRRNMKFLAETAFPNKIKKDLYHAKGTRGWRADFHLTSKIEKIFYPKNVVDQMNGFDFLLVVSPIVGSANKSIQVKNYKKELSE